MLRHLIATAAVVACSALVAAPASAGIAPGPTSATDPTGDVSSKSLDITKASIKPLNGGYKAAVKYQDLKVSKATRRVFTVTTYSLPSFPDAGSKLTSPTDWTLELRTKPDGTVVSKYWRNGAVASCAGAKAAAVYADEKVTFVFPEACIGPFGILTNASSRAWKQPASVPWSPTTLETPPGAVVDNLDSPLFVG